MAGLTEALKLISGGLKLGTKLVSALIVWIRRHCRQKGGDTESESLQAIAFILSVPGEGGRRISLGNFLLAALS